MTDQRSDDHDSQCHEAIEEGREDQHQQQTAGAQGDEHLVDHARADLVLIGKHQEMNTTQRGDDHQKDERQCLMIVKNGEIESGSWMCQCHKMCSQRVEVLEGNVVSTDKPIGHHESQERRQKGAKGKSQDVRAQDEPL